MNHAAVIAVPLAALLAFAAAEPAHLDYPKTPHGDQVDDYHGVKVADPYRWLEDDVRKSKEVADWVEAENKVTDAYLKAIPEREAIHKRLTELWNYEKYSAPFKAGGRYFYTKNDGLQNQAVLYTLDQLDGDAARAARSEHAGRRTAPSPSPAWPSATTASTSPTAWPRPAPTGTPGTSCDVGDRQDARRRAEVDQVQRRRLDQGRQGLLLQPLRRAEEGRAVPGLEPQPASSTTTASARRRPTTCSSTSGPTIPTGASTPTSPRTAGTWSSPSGRAPTHKNRVTYKRPGRAVRPCRSS